MSKFFRTIGNSISVTNAIQSKNLIEFIGGSLGVIVLLVIIGLILYYVVPKSSGFTSSIPVNHQDHSQNKPHENH